MKRNALVVAVFSILMSASLIPAVYSHSVRDCVVSSVPKNGPMDSPWPMQSHDVFHTGQSPYSTANNNGAEIWIYKTYGMMNSGIAIDKVGVLYFGDLNNLYAVYPNGTLKWSYSLFGDKWSTPALVEDGTIYLSSYDNHLCAFNPNGTMKWRFDALNSISSSPVIADDGTIYFGTLGWPDNGCRVYAVNQNGTLKWYYQTGGKVYSDPAIGKDGVIFIGSNDNYIYALNPNGTLRWRFKTDGEIHSNPCIGPNGIIYFGSNDCYLYAVYPDGTLHWKYQINSNPYSNVAIGTDGTIYCPDHSLYALYPDGTLKWQFDFDNGMYVSHSSPAISKEGTIYIGVSKPNLGGGYIFAINPDGTERWRRDISNFWVESSPAIGADGTVYIGSVVDDYPYGEYGYVYAFGEGNLAPEKPTIIGPSNGKVGIPYTYTVQAMDPDNEFIYYYVDWGDGLNSGWQGPYASGTAIPFTHLWLLQGSIPIRAKAKDEQGKESNWATYAVSMPKMYSYNPIIKLIRKMLERFQTV